MRVWAFWSRPGAQIQNQTNGRRVIMSGSVDLRRLTTAAGFFFKLRRWSHRAATEAIAHVAALRWRFRGSTPGIWYALIAANAKH